MKRSKFSDEQILKIVREGEAGRAIHAVHPFVVHGQAFASHEHVQATIPKA